MLKNTYGFGKRSNSFENVLIKLDKRNLKKDNKLLIIGKIPPPIGGVTIHVQRLLSFLEKDKVPHTFATLDKENLGKIITQIFSHKLIHIHTSSPYARLMLILVCTIARKKSMFTLHGNLNRFGWFKNQLDYIAIQLASFPIVINEGSYEIAKRKNKNTLLASAFIPPVNTTPLDEKTSSRVSAFVDKYKVICCTNAFNLTYDKDGNEIYGVTDLLQIFLRLKNTALVFSDPSAAYTEYWKRIGVQIPENVLVLNFPHDFINIIKLSDIFLRTTTTDGDSLSVKEGLYFQKNVICSDCVSRPKGCILYQTGNQIELQQKIGNVYKDQMNLSRITNGYTNVREIYKMFL